MRTGRLSPADVAWFESRPKPLMSAICRKRALGYCAATCSGSKAPEINDVEGGAGRLRILVARDNQEHAGRRNMLIEIAEEGRGIGSGLKLVLPPQQSR